LAVVADACSSDHVLQGLHSLKVRNFGVLGDVDVKLGRLNVLAGPNGSGKTTLPGAVQLIGDAARLGLDEAVSQRGGLALIQTRPADTPVFRRITTTLHVRAVVTQHAHEGARDEYTLNLRPVARHTFTHTEAFSFKRTKTRGRRITLKGGKWHVTDDDTRDRRLSLDKDAFGLAVLPQLGSAEGATEVRKVQELFTTFRVFEIDVPAARRPVDRAARSPLKSDASNLAAFLAFLKLEHTSAFDALVADARLMVPGLTDVVLRPVGGAGDAVTIDVVDDRLAGATPLRNASFGTVRLLALLAMLHDPNPPLLTCVEEIDHGLHPHLFDRLVELLRAGSKKTQFLLATHSPALVNRLAPEELIVCERDPATGLARIPAISTEEVRAHRDASDYGLGELWFSGSLGGVPP
jgi:predicted ATPase